jgi:alkanesulfonate monooxygenase SsuD/methylene tetrahydromethanopterin reductase-like flavin-dependent oxidoreductase (luciferase family)
MRHAVDAIAHYRARFTPSPALAAPYAILAVTAICADSDAEAERMAAPVRLAVVKNRTGRRAPIASIDEALAYDFTAEERAIADDFLTGAAIGSPAAVAGRLTALARDTGASELMLSTLVPDLAARQHALRRIAEAMA